MNINDFPVNKRQGIIGENIMAKYLRAEGWQIDNYSLAKDKAGTDISAIRFDYGIEEIKVDVKYDSYISTSNNAPFETWSNTLTGKLGWGLDLSKTCELIAVIDKSSPKDSARIWIFRIADMRSYYYAHESEWTITKDKKCPFRVAESRAYKKDKNGENKLIQVTECG